MAKKNVTNLIIIDASGSMRNKQNEVVGGLKQLFNEIKADALRDKKKANITTIVLDFSSAGDIRVLVNSSKSEELTDELADSYRVRGMTALFDAIGKGFSLIPEKAKSVFVNILTDGEENDSKEFKAETIKALFSEAESKKWAVTFMGTTKEAIEKAKDLGVSAGNTYTFNNSAAGVTHSFDKMKSARSIYYMASLSGNEVTTDLMEDKE